MKRYILLLILCVFTFANAKAQGDTKKAYFPEQGDIAITFDAVPILKYVGELFNGTNGNSLGKLHGEPVSGSGVESFKIDDITPTISIMGKYMFSDNIAFRLNFGVLARSITTNKYVGDDLANVYDPLNEDKLIDTRFDTKRGFSTLLGAEYRTGKNRVQGVFGGGLIFGSNGVKSEYRYANALTQLNQEPSSAFETMKDKYRTLNEVTKSNFFFGITGFVGVEWFVAPMISLGAEVNLSAYSVKEGQTYVVTEGYNSKLDCVETRTELAAPGNKAVVFGTDNLGGTLNISFYF